MKQSLALSFILHPSSYHPFFVSSVARWLKPVFPLYIRIRQHEIPHHGRQLVHGFSEAAERSDGRAKSVEFRDCHPVRVIRAPEIRDLLIHSLDDLRTYRLLNRVLYFEIRRIGLPGPLARHRVDEVAADELRPVTEVAVRRHEQTSPVTTMLKDSHRPA